MLDGGTDGREREFGRVQFVLKLFIWDIGWRRVKVSQAKTVFLHEVIQNIYRKS